MSRLLNELKYTNIHANSNIVYLYIILLYYCNGTKYNVISGIFREMLKFLQVKLYSVIVK